jgi:alkylation response protein AidB-like acyl-CoA dehydrogenase
MDIFLTDEERAFQAELNTLASSRIAPVAAEIDERDSVPPEIFKLLDPYRTLSYPAQYGGSAKGTTYSCLLTEALGRACPALVTYIEIAELFGGALIQGGSDDQRSEYLRRLGTGEVGAYALTDSAAGSDPGSMESEATETAGGYRLRGSKRHITYFDIADFFVVFARARDGITGFVLDKPDSGIEMIRRSEWSGLRGHIAWDFSFDIEVPASARISAEGTGLRLALNVLNHTRITLAAGHCGLARAALELATEFARTRIVGGRPLWENQAISFAIVETQAQVEAARLLTYHAARLSEKEVQHRRETSQAKFAAAEALLQAVGLCNRVLGGLGGHLDNARRAIPARRLHVGGSPRDHRDSEAHRGPGSIRTGLREGNTSRHRRPVPAGSARRRRHGGDNHQDGGNPRRTDSGMWWPRDGAAWHAAARRPDRRPDAAPGCGRRRSH